MNKEKEEERSDRPFSKKWENKEKEEGKPDRAFSKKWESKEKEEGKPDRVGEQREGRRQARLSVRSGRTKRRKKKVRQTFQ